MPVTGHRGHRRPPALATRRELLAGLGVAAGAALAAPALSRAAKPRAKPGADDKAEDKKGEGVVLGTGRHRYEWVKGWGKLPDGMEYGNTHGGIVEDEKGRIFVNTDSEHAIIVYDKAGKFVKSWGKDFKNGVHGMFIVKEGRKELLWLAHQNRHEAVKTTLDGEVLMTLGVPEKAGVYKDASEYKPTSVAVAPDGSVFVADGYGLSWIHKYSAKGEYLKSFGGRGTEPGKFRTPHGIFIDTRKKDRPLLVVADRANRRLQWLDFDGKFVEEAPGIFSLPCQVHQSGDDLVVPDLDGRVTIIDKDNKLVCHLGENIDPERRGKNKVARETWRDGEFIAPHGARWDRAGNLYVMDWNYQGRITKLRRLKG
jgi:hypothetical protein